MIKQALIELRDYVLEKNTYFSKGFSLVYQDEGVWYGEDDKTAVFPADNIGNYFYFRLPSDVGLAINDAYKIGNCLTPVVASASVIVVAFVKDADTDLLVTNLVNTFQSKSGVGFNSAIISNEKAVRQELSFLSGDNLNSALARIPKNTAIVSVNITLTVPLAFNNCIVQPCIPCPQ